MSMERKNVSFSITEIKEDTEQKAVVVVSGTANKVGIVDRGGDMTIKGTFTRTVKETPIVPALADHWMSKVIGLASLSEGKDGSLMAELKINTAVQEGMEKLALIKQFKKEGRPMQMSMGYITKDYELKQTDGNVVRVLKDVDVVEVSVTAFAMNQDSDIDKVKEDLQAEIKSLKDTLTEVVNENDERKRQTLIAKIKAKINDVGGN